MKIITVSVLSIGLLFGSCIVGSAQTYDELYRSYGGTTSDEMGASIRRQQREQEEREFRAQQQRLMREQEQAYRDYNTRQNMREPSTTSPW